jgi:hypothetical protein
LISTGSLRILKGSCQDKGITSWIEIFTQDLFFLNYSSEESITYVGVGEQDIVQGAGPPHCDASAVSGIALLNTFAVKDIGGLQEKHVKLAYKEVSVIDRMLTKSGYMCVVKSRKY